MLPRYDASIYNANRLANRLAATSKPPPYRMVCDDFVRLPPQPTVDRHAQDTVAIRDPPDCALSSRAARTARLWPDIPVLLVSCFIEPFPNGSLPIRRGAAHRMKPEPIRHPALVLPCNTCGFFKAFIRQEREPAVRLSSRSVFPRTARGWRRQKAWNNYCGPDAPSAHKANGAGGAGRP